MFHVFGTYQAELSMAPYIRVVAAIRMNTVVHGTIKKIDIFTNDALVLTYLHYNLHNSHGYLFSAA